MAINTSDYNPTKEKNIKVHKKDKRLFYFDFRINKRRYTKLFRITATNHSPSEMLKTARQELDSMKDEIKNGTFGNDRVKLNFLFKEYMKTQQQTKWTHKKQHIYDLYIGDSKLTTL